MKQFSTIVNTVLACTLIFILFSVGLPNFNVRAVTPTPTANQLSKLSPPHVTPVVPFKSVGWRWSM